MPISKRIRTFIIIVVGALLLYTVYKIGYTRGACYGRLDEIIGIIHCDWLMYQEMQKTNYPWVSNTLQAQMVGKVFAYEELEKNIFAVGLTDKYKTKLFLSRLEEAKMIRHHLYGDPEKLQK